MSNPGNNAFVSAPLPEPVSIEQETIFSGLFSIEQLGWIGAGLAGFLLLLTIRDFIFARRKWLVPLLFILRTIACLVVLFVLSGPTKSTRKVFESGHNTVGIYLDTSASMTLQDPADEKGHLIRWETAATSDLAAVDQAKTRIDAAVSITDRALVVEQLEEARKTLKAKRKNLPWQVLVDETLELIDEALAKEEENFIEAKEIAKRIGVIAGELARNETLELTENPSRLDRAKTMLRSLPEETKDLQVEQYRFDSSVETADDWNVSGERPADSDINAVLRQIETKVLSDSIDAAVIVTDAVHNANQVPLEVPSGLKDFPLFLVPAGGDYQLKDLTLWKASAPTSIAKGDFLSIDCLVGSTGFEGETTQLRLLQNGKEIDSVPITFSSDGEDVKHRFSTSVKASGSQQFEVELVPLPGELQAGNNKEFLDVDVFVGDLNVLLVDGWPRWETRYLSNLFRREDSIKHQEILFAPEPPDPFPDMLSSRSKLNPFQIVILGEVGPDFLGVNEITNLQEYVNDGGNLVVIAGKESMPKNYQISALADILPVDMTNQRRQPPGKLQLAPTPAGINIAALSLEDNRMENESVWKLGSSLLSLTTLSTYNVPKPGAQVILEAQTVDKSKSIPFLTWHRYGSGRVFFLSAPTTYHLRYRFGDRYHYRFWGQFLRWVTVAEMNRDNGLIHISTKEKRFVDGDSPVVVVELRDSDGKPARGDVVVRLHSPDGKTREFNAAPVSGEDYLFEANLPELEHGRYKIEAGGSLVDILEKEFGENEDRGIIAKRTEFIVEALPDEENGDRNCDWETAHRIVNATAGAIVAPRSLETAIAIVAKKQSKVRHQELQQKPLWDRWPLFFLILLFLSVEWAGRKYAGLI